jgi:hypothetical protein
MYLQTSFLSAEAFTYADLYTMLETEYDCVVDTTCSYAYSVMGDVSFEGRFIGYYFWFTVDGKEIVAWARSSEALWEIVDVVLRLVAQASFSGSAPMDSC